ncbi:thiopeptide-type bacteriocin [Streptacidiphilus sp. N1-12]|uniref:Thiopeptide-type bacteriocin n=2 Tax=Streptacidiphilus alkalitolerans TaxID=3342712 RepID=A0ABV6VM65_9ACTN
MSVDFAVFNLTELAVLDATDAVAMPEMGASYKAAFVEDMDDLIGEGAEDNVTLCCSSSSSCCCC